MNITEKLLTINPYSRPGTKRSRTTKIAIHYVGNPGSTAIANRNYFESLKDKHVYASSHYIIGLQGEIIRCVPEDEIAYTTNSANAYSIGIECCHPRADGVFNQVTCNALVELCADLCRRYHLTEEDLIRHYDVTGKACPLAWASNSGPKYQDWLAFKLEVKVALGTPSEDEELAKAVSKLINAGVKINYNSWKRLDLIKLNNVPALLIKLGGVDTLIAKGFITESERWLTKAYKAQDVRSLLIKFARSFN